MSTTRIFASVEAFRLACPLCSQITVVDPEGPKRRRKRNNVQWRYNRVRASWDARHQILKCAYCGAVWQIGLVVRPREGLRERPTDIVPNKRELARLRNRYGGGWWIDDPHRRDEPINQYEPEACACAPDPWKASCPVHGKERIGEP